MNIHPLTLVELLQRRAQSQPEEIAYEFTNDTTEIARTLLKENATLPNSTIAWTKL